VEQGMGLSFLPEYIVRPALAAGRLARLNVPDCAVEMHRQLFYHRDKWLTPQMNAFIQLVRETASAPLSEH
jgi:transcriptional regulator